MIIILRRIFSVTGGASGLDLAVLAVGLVAGSVIVATLTDVVPEMSRATRPPTYRVGVFADDPNCPKCPNDSQHGGGR